jgi:hypothetical protein
MKNKKIHHIFINSQQRSIHIPRKSINFINERRNKRQKERIDII